VQLPLRLGDPGGQFGSPRLGVPELRPRHLNLLISRLGIPQRRAQFNHGRLDYLEFGLVLGPPGQFGLNLPQPQFDHLELGPNGSQSLLSPLLVNRPAAEPQDVPQHALPLGRGLDGKLVSPALAQEGRVDKGLIVEPQDALDLCLRGPHAALGDGTPAPALPPSVPPTGGEGNVLVNTVLPTGGEGLCLEIEQGTATLASLAPAQHAIGLPSQPERKLDHHLVFAQTNQVVVPSGSGLAPHCPGDSVEQRRLARAILTSQARDVDAGEV